MRDRHIPRICRACGAPLARQEERCWQCDTTWETSATTPESSAADRWNDEGGSLAAAGTRAPA